MKYLSKLLSMLLVGAMLYSTGCTDFTTDIENLENKVDEIQKELQEGQIDPLKADLEALQNALNDAIEDANAKIAENKKAIEALEAVDAEHDAAIDAANAAIAEALEDIAGLAGDLESLESQHATDIAAVYAKISEEVAKVNDAIAAAVERISDNEEAIKTLKEKDAELAADIEANYAAITVNAAAIAENAAAIKANAGNIATNAEAISALQADLLDLSSSFTTYKAATDAAIESLKSRMTTAEEAVETLEGSVEELYQLHDNQNLLIDNLEKNMETFKEYTQVELDALAEADKALNQLIVNLENSFIDYQKIVNAQFEKAFGDIAKNTELINQLSAKHEEDVTSLVAQDAAILKTLDQHVGWLLELEENLSALDLRVGALEGVVAKVQTNIASMQVTIDSLTQDLTDLENTLIDFQKQVNTQIERIDAAIVKALADAQAYADNAANEAVVASKGYTDTVVAALQTAIEKEIGAIRTAIDQLSTYATAIETKVDEYIVKTDAALAGLRADLDKVINRVQSIVFVPEYSDGKGTINYAKAGETLVEGRSTMVYQVYPAECAALIANAPAVEGTVAPLSYDLEGLKTRGGMDKAPQFNIVGVEGDLDGRLYVTFDARNLGSDFYAGKMEYAASLVVAYETAKLSTVYTNVVPAKDAQKIGMAIMFNGEAVSEEYTYFEFQYDNLERVETVLANHYVQFSVAGKKYAGINELNAAGYNVALEGSYYTHREHNVHLGDKPFVVAENADGVLEVKVNEVKREYIYQPLEVGYQYTLGTLNTKAYATAWTVPVKATLNYPAYDINWLYADDASIDAAKLNGDDTAVYSRTNLSLAAYTEPEGEELPSDITVAQVIKSALKKDVVVTLDGVEVAVNAAFVLDADDNVKLNFSGFEWDKKYEVTAVYGVMDQYGQESAVVTVKATVNTHNRTDDLIEVNFDDAQWNLTKDFLYQSETVADSLNDVYEAAKSYLGEMSAADFLKDIFVEKDFVASENLANGEAEDNTKFVIVNDGAAVKTVYNINDYAEIPEAIEYVYNITTWYGQEIVITKKLNIGLTPVEITLATESKKLVKDLEFVTAPESLAAIYEKVTNVDKTDFNADEYLFAIFAEPKFRALRAQKDLANDVELASTKLVVAPKDGATAKAAYNFADFDVTPESVVYKSTYTTWYGQEITINKTVNIDWTTYNYVAVPEWVYNTEENNPEIPYSNAIPYRINDPAPSSFLKNIMISLDMDTAFIVVDKDGNDVTNELANLGLTSKFGFTKNPVDSRIKFLEPTNNLYYHGHDLTVGVKAQLTLENSNGVKTVLPTNFDEGQIYDGYYVKQHNPVGKLKASNLDIAVAPIAKQYTYFAMNQLKMADDRQQNLIARGDLVKNDDNEIAFSNGGWVVGDGVSNGFATGAKVDEIYGLKVTKFTCTGIPESLKHQLIFDQTTGELYFNNWNSIELTTPIKLTITVDVTHMWGDDSVQFNVNLFRE